MSGLVWSGLVTYIESLSKISWAASRLFAKYHELIVSALITSLYVLKIREPAADIWGEVLTFRPLEKHL